MVSIMGFNVSKYDFVLTYKNHGINRDHPCIADKTFIFKTLQTTNTADLRNLLPEPVVDSTVPSVINTVCIAYEYEQRKNGRDYKASKTFLYFVVRASLNNVEHANVSLRETLSVLKKVGVCSDDSWYDVDYQPSHSDLKKALEEASNERIDGFYHVKQDLHELRASLTHGIPVLFFITMTTDSVITATVEGVSSALLMGYDDDARKFLVLIGERFVLYDFEYIMSPLCCDFWMIQKQTKKEKRKPSMCLIPLSDNESDND